MARALLLVLLVTLAALLVAALFRDRRGRGSQQTAALRSAFLHGAPLAAPVRPPSLTEVVAGGWLRFRVPGTWKQEGAAGGALVFRDRSAESRTLRLELHTASWPDTVDEAAVAASFRGSLPEKDRSVEPLPNGNVLLKWLEPAREGGRDFVVYRWRLGRPRPPHEVRIAAFSLEVEAERARDVVVQADLAAIEREIRDAALG